MHESVLTHRCRPICLIGTIEGGQNYRLAPSFTPRAGDRQKPPTPPPRVWGF
jgi:hypothetical protein